MRRPTCPTASRTRRGSVALEALLILPVFALLLAAFAEFAAAVNAEEKLARASHAGARAASAGGSLDQIEEVVDLNLGRSLLARHRRVVVARVVHTPDGDVLEPVADPGLVPPHTPLVVVVEAPAAKVVPNVLRVVGIDLTGETLSGQTAMWKE